MFERYEERCELLLDSAYIAPILLPLRFWQLSQDAKIGLPSSHPWQTKFPDPGTEALRHVRRGASYRCEESIVGRGPSR